MPKKYRTNKGTREFDDKLTRQEIEAQLIGEGVTEYEPLTSGRVLNINPSLLRGGEQFSGNTGNEAFASPDLPLSAGSAAASIARAGASRAVAGRAMSAIPHPVAKILGGILAYTGTDQVGQEAQSRFLGERPKGAIEQIVEPENEVVGRLMGTAENAAIDWGAGKVVDAGINAAKGIYNKFFPTLAPIPPKVGVTGHSFSEDPIKDAQYWDIPNPKPAQPSIAGYGNDAAAAEYAMLKAKPTDQLSSAERLRLAGIERKLLGEKTKTIDLPGQTIHMGDGKITDPGKLLPPKTVHTAAEFKAWQESQGLRGMRHPMVQSDEAYLAKFESAPAKPITVQDELIANIQRLKSGAQPASMLEEEMPKLSRMYSHLTNPKSNVDQAFRIGDVDVIIPGADVRKLGLTAYATPGVTVPAVKELGKKLLGREGDFVILSERPHDVSEFLDIISEELTHAQHYRLGDKLPPSLIETLKETVIDKIPGYASRVYAGKTIRDHSISTLGIEGVAKSIAGNSLPVPEREAFKAGMEKAFTIDELKQLRKYQSYGIGGVALALGSEAERKEKLNSKVGVIPEFEQAIRDPQALQKLEMFEEGKKTKEDLRSYFIQSRLQAGNFKEAMNESAAAALYTPKERAELGAFFKTVDEKKLPSDIQLGPKGITISGPMAQEAGLGAMALGLTFYELSKRILLRKGSSAAAKAIGDYISGNAQRIPARKMGKYFLRNALRGADVLIQTADGEKQVTVE